MTTRCILGALVPAIVVLTAHAAGAQANLRVEFSRRSEIRIPLSNGTLVLQAATDAETGRMSGRASYGPGQRDCGGPLSGMVEVYSFSFSAGQCSGWFSLVVRGLEGSVTTPLGTESVLFWPGR